ncbi:SPFH domain-containing protein [Lutibacter sp.]|uniref:SPFH domain-containing protein n=1 Tax=Lutibacter sp. TaxID=1925666 RepID=UPI001A2C695D|nr:SPFH domain-containing protein [Lutibacter sp.]MBI9041681.1 SPFH domain-containing protein [Lutibacter sp.]
MAIIDLVRWTPQGNQTIYAYRFPETNLSTYTQLIVQESQEAILFSKGQIVGKFGPGKHTLNTENLPILRSLYGLPFGSKNPFTAEVWFVNKLQPYNIDWSIDRMDIHDTDYNTGIPLISNGRYGLKINDSERFLIKIVGAKNSFDQNDLTDQFFGEFSTKTKSTILQFMINNKIGLKQISAHLDNISEHLKTIMLPFWENLGLELTKFYVTSIEVDSTTEVGRRVLDAISRQSAQSIGGYTWQQEKAFDVAKDAVDGLANSNSGIMGAVIATNMMGGLGGASGGVMQPQYNQPAFVSTNQGQQGGTNQPVNQIREVYCSNCSKKFPSSHRFCSHCGDPYDACPKCGTDNDKSAQRCVSCGTQLQSETVLCTNCNTPLAAGSSFCGNCGKQQADDKCSRCSTQLAPSTKFCPKCGQKR